MIWIKRLFIALTLIGLTALGAGVYLGYKYQDKAVPVIVDQLNQYLLTPVDVGDIQLSFIERFPQASLKLSDVTAMGSDAAVKADTLFHLKEVYLTFNLIDWYNGNYVLNHVEAHNGFLHLNKRKNGAINYRFIDTSLTTQSTGTFQLDLNRILLEQVRVAYVDDFNHEHFDIEAHRFSAKGSFSDQQQAVALYGSSTIHHFQIGELNYLAGERVFIDAGLEFNPDLDFYQISRGILKLKDTYELTLNGKIKGREIDLIASAESLDIEALPTLLPGAIAKPIADLQGRGSISVTTQISRGEQEELPSVTSDLVIRDASVQMQALSEPLSIQHAVAHYTNGAHRSLASSQLSIDTASLTLGKSKLQGSAKIHNFNRMAFRMNADVALDGASLQKALTLDQFSTFEGNANGSLFLRGTLPSDSMTIQHLIDWEKEGDFSLSNLVMESDSTDLAITNAIVHIKRSSIAIDSASGSWNQVGFTAAGWSKHGFHALLKGKAPHHFRGQVELDEYEANSSSSDAGFDFPEGYDIEIDLQVGTLRYNQLVANDVATQLKLHHALTLDQLTANMLEGSLQGNLSITPVGSNTRTNLTLSGRHLNIRTLFQTFNNFEQTAIGYEHLKGFADVDAKFSYQRDTKANTVMPTIKGNARIRVTNGELIEYKPLYGLVADFRKNKILSLFIKLDEFEKRLHHVKFDTLANTLSVSNNEVIIPEMLIKSNALNLTLSGKQTFDHDIDYRMSFNLKQVLLANRDQPTPTEYGYIEDDGTGNKMIYLHLTGNADNPIVSFDKLASKKRRKEVVQQEVTTTKAILQQEFGLFKGDSLAPLPPQEKEPNNELDLEEFNQQLESSTTADSTNKPVKTDSTKRKSKWKKLLEKVSGEESNSKFENWEFEEENDDW